MGFISFLYAVMAVCLADMFVAVAIACARTIRRTITRSITWNPTSMCASARACLHGACMVCVCVCCVCLTVTKSGVAGRLPSLNSFTYCVMYLPTHVYQPKLASRSMYA